MLESFALDPIALRTKISSHSYSVQLSTSCHKVKVNESKIFEVALTDAFYTSAFRFVYRELLRMQDPFSKLPVIILR